MAFRDFGLGRLRVLRLSLSGPSHVRRGTSPRLSRVLPSGGDLLPEEEGVGVGWQDLPHTRS